MIPCASLERGVHEFTFAIMGQAIRHGWVKGEAGEDCLSDEDCLKVAKAIEEYAQSWSHGFHIALMQ